MCILSQLSESMALNATPGGSITPEVWSQRIEFEDLWKEQQLLHFHLSTATSGSLASDVGTFLLRSLFAAAPDQRRKQVFLIIDEFTSVAGHVLDVIQQQARSKQLGVIVANQSPSHIRDEKTRNTVLGTVRFHQCFGLSDTNDQRWFERGSGDRAHRDTATNVSAKGEMSYTTRETILPHVPINLLKQVSSTALLSLYCSFSGHTNGMNRLVKAHYQTTKEQYERLKTMPWPAKCPATLLQPAWQPTEPLRPGRESPSDSNHAPYLELPPRPQLLEDHDEQ